MAHSRGPHGTMSSPVDLETLFAHPEGLQTAKDIVVHHLLESRYSKVSGGSSRSPREYRVSRPMSEMNPEMPGAIKDLLMFRDPNTQVQSTRLFESNVAMEIHPADREMSDTSRIHLSPPFAPQFQLSQTEATPRTSYHTERSNRPISLGRSTMDLLSRTNSLLPSSASSSGTASPYTNDAHSQHKLPPISELEKPTSTSNSLPPISLNTTYTKPQSRPSAQVGTLTSGTAAYPGHLRKPSERTISVRPVNSSPAPKAQYQGSYREISARPGQSQKYSSGLSVTYSPIESHPTFNRQSDNSSTIFTSPTWHPGLDRNKERNWTPIQSRASYPPHPTNTLNDTMSPFGKLVAPKRKIDALEKSATKKQKIQRIPKPKRATKPKVTKDEPAKFQLPDAIWMRILELSPPAFLLKVRSVSKRFKSMVDRFDSIYDYCRMENFGYDMPKAPLGISTRKYNNLLRGGKGCLIPGCDDKNTTRAHWSWATRWCMKCWKSKIEREDRVIKTRTTELTRTVLEGLLDCIAYGMHDSFMKPHDIVEPGEERGRSAPRLYKYYVVEDVTTIIAEYKALTPPPYVEDPTHTAEQKATAAAAHQVLMDGVEEIKTAFLTDRKAKNDEHMDQVKKIEGGMRMRRDTLAVPYKSHRDARKALFTKRAQEEIGQVPTEFVQNTKAFKAATRIFRDSGTERGWQTLKPKIVKEWEASKTGEGKDSEGASEASPGLNDDDDLAEEETEDNNDLSMSMVTKQSQVQDVVQNFPSHGPPQQIPFNPQSHIRQQLNVIQRTVASGSNLHNTFSSMQMPNHGHFHSTARSTAGLTFSTPLNENQHSSVSNTLANSSSNPGRSGVYAGINMFPNGTIFGNHRPSHPPSYQHGSVTMSSVQNATPSTIMAISSIIQQPFGFNSSD